MTPFSPQPLLELLLREQRADGAFPGSSSAIFGTLLTATILAELQEYPAARALCSTSLAYIDAQRQDDGSLSYWERGSDAANRTPYPPDMDDTALAAAAELLIDPNRFGGSKMAQFVKLLTSVEVAEGGPYRTWLIDSSADARWEDIDLGVNANVAFALSLLDIELPNLERLFDGAITRTAYESCYYHLPLMLLFFISRSYRGAHAAEAISHINSLRHADGTWGPATETALALCALSNFGFDIAAYSDSISWLRDAAAALQPEPLYRERIAGGTMHCYTNRSVSLALIALALHRATSIRTDPESAEIPAFEASAYRAFMDTCSAAGHRARAHAYLDALRSKPISKGAASLPQLFWSMLHKPDNALPAVPIETVHQLSVAHIYGWIGYGIIDAVMDNQAAASELPFALFCIRSFSETYHHLFPGDRSSFFDSSITQTEHAFAQEHEDRLQLSPGGYVLASLTDRTPVSWQKSCGHALPALALLLLSGYTETAPVYTHTHSFFREFLHARQLHDDAHDFIEDLSAGRVTVIGKLLLERYIAVHPEQTAISISDAEAELRQLFWQDCFPSVYGMIETAIAAARTHLQQLPLTDTSPFESLLSGLLRAQQQAHGERTRMLAFINSY